jgi:hypothetical protein
VEEGRAPYVSRDGLAKYYNDINDINDIGDMRPKKKKGLRDNRQALLYRDAFTADGTDARR